MKFLVVLSVFSLCVYLSEGKAFLLGPKLAMLGKGFNKGGYEDNSIGFADAEASSGISAASAGSSASSGGLSLGGGFGGGLGGGLGGGFGGMIGAKVAAKTSLLEMKKNAINSMFDTIIGAKRSLAGGVGSIGGGFPSFGGLKLGGSTSSSSAGASSGAIAPTFDYVPPQRPHYVVNNVPVQTHWIVTEQRVPIQGPYPHFDAAAAVQPIPVPHDSYGPPAVPYPSAEPLFPAPLPATDVAPAVNCTH